MSRSHATGRPRALAAGRQVSTRGISWSGAALSTLVALIVSIAGCGSTGTEGTGTSAEPLGTIICGMFPTGDPSLPERPEFYIVHSMNRKLSYYPEFAAAIGMKSVSNCEEARLFSQRYATYFAAHPFFDKDLPSDPTVTEPPAIPPAAASPQVQKIFNGSLQSQSSDSFPVVQILHTFPAGSRFFNGNLINNGNVYEAACGGVFISQNWILTAAHCIATLALQYDPNRPGAVNRAQWVTAAQWDIKRANGRRDNSLFAVSIVHPAYTDAVHPVANPTFLGDSGVFVNYDLALLYLPPTQNDYRLAADGAKSSWDVQAAQASSLVSNWTLTAYGWGPTDDFGTNQDALSAFTQSGSQLINGGMFDPATGGNTVFGSRTSLPTWSSWALCKGDSGGPLVREGLDASNNVITTVVVAVASEVSLNINDPPNSKCGSHVGDTNWWARTDVGKSFFVDIMKHWQLTPTFNVDAHTFDEPGQADSYLQLHGSSCSRDCDCLTSEICYNPIKSPNALQGCTACMDCGCIQGQCLPSPDWVGSGVGTKRTCPP